MFTDALNQSFRRIWWSLVVRGLLALALGVLILVKPFDSIAAFALVIAIWALFSGITEIVHSFDVKPFGSWWLMLLGGLVSAAFGAAALYFYPVLSLAFAVTWASSPGSALSGNLGAHGRRSAETCGTPWGWVFAWGLLSMAAAVAAWISPPRRSARSWASSLGLRSSAASPSSSLPTVSSRRSSR